MVSKWVQICDLSHDEAAEQVFAVEAVAFPAADGRTYELDLCDEHLAEYRKLESQWATWQRVARVRVAETAPPAPRRGRVSDSAEHRKENAAIRAWVKTQPDFSLGERGRIPANIRQRYRDAMGQQARNRWDENASSNGAVPVGATSE